MYSYIIDPNIFKTENKNNSLSINDEDDILTIAEIKYIIETDSNGNTNLKPLDYEFMTDQERRSYYYDYYIENPKNIFRRENKFQIPFNGDNSIRGIINFHNFETNHNNNILYIK